MLTALLVLFFLLAIPLNLTYQLSWQKQLEGKAMLRWLFGLVRVQFTPPRAERAAREEKQVEGSTEHKSKTARRKLKPLVALRQKTFRRLIFRFAYDLWHAIRTRDLHLRVRIGLGDPADTGQLWPLFGPLSGLLANIENTSIELEPEFIDTVFELDSSGRISVIPLQLLYLMLGLLCSPIFWRGMRRMNQVA